MPVVRSLSIIQLILFAFIAIALPLVWAVLTALYQVDTLVKKHTDTIMKVKKETLTSRSVAEHLKSMERSANQFRVLGDAALREVYVKNRKQFRSLLDSYMESGQDRERADLAQILKEMEQQLFASLQANSIPAKSNEIESLIARLYDYSRNLVAETDALLVEQTDLFALEVEELKQQLLAQAFLALPVTVILGILFVILITKPIRQLDHVVRGLGQGDYNLDIDIGGPHDLQALGTRLNWLRDRLREVEQQKQAFLRNISHELKTPLTSIREGTELLAGCSSAQTNTEQHEIIEILKDSSINLQDLIENLLRFNELTAASGDIERINFKVVIDDVIKSHQLMINMKKLRIQKDIETIDVSANSNQIRLVIDNLLSNAIKFSPHDREIRIGIKKMKKNVIIEIEDSGPGIPAADVPQIFDLFYRGSDAASGSLSGNGLGLAIVKEIVGRLNGKIDLIHIARGTKFIVSLPISDDGGLHYGH